MGATAAPSVCAANSPIIISGELWATKATTSPRFTPSEASPAATARRRASSADQLRSCQRPEGPRYRTAGRGGSARARAAISSGTVWKGTAGRGGPLISSPSIGTKSTLPCQGSKEGPCGDVCPNRSVRRGRGSSRPRGGGGGRRFAEMRERLKWAEIAGREWRCEAGRALLLRRRLLLAELLDHLLLRRPRHRLVLGELHGELALALGRRAEIGRVPEHLRERHVRARDQVPLHRLRVLDDPPPLVQLAHHRSLELLRSLHLYVHDRLEDDRLRLLVRLAEAHQGGRLEGLLAGVHGVGEAVVDHAADLHHREADQRTLLDRLLEPLVAGGDELPRNRPADHVGDQLVLLGGVLRPRLDVPPRAPGPAGAARP